MRSMFLKLGLLTLALLLATAVAEAAAPVLTVPGAQSVDEGANLNFGISATDADGDSLIFSAESVPVNGTFSDNFNGTGTFDFNPDFTQANVYNVTFIVSDGVEADTGTVEVTVNNVNRVPVVTVPGAQSVDEGANLNFGISATDADGDSLILTAEGLPTNATFTDNFNGTGTFDFNPDFTQANVYNITFIASDGTDADTDFVQVTVNDVNRAPVITVPGAQSVDENANLNFMVTGSDVDGDSLIFTAVGVPSKAAFADNYDGSARFEFNPDFTQSGVYNVTFIVSDGAEADTGSVQITVNNVNRVPVVTVPGAQSVDEGANLNFGISATDADGDPLTLTAEGVPTNATFTDNLNGTGTLDFNPDFTQASVYNITFIASDGTDADTDFVQITVNNVNQVPVVTVPGAQSVDEGANLNFGISATDADGDPLTLTAEGVPTNATFTDNLNGTGTFDFNPDFTQANVYNITFIASDGTDADTDFVQITVNNVNQVPVVTVPGAQSVDEGANLNFGISATDADGDPLTLTAEGVPTNATFTDNLNGTGTLDFNPDFTQANVYSITFIASDGTDADTDYVQITVNNVNQVPVVTVPGAQSVDEGSNLNFGISATDADGDPLTLTAEGVPTNATFTDNLNGTGTLDFNPDFTQANVYNITFIASDGTDADTDFVQITVNNVNQVPIVTVPGAQSVDEGANLNFGISAADADGDPLTLTAEGVPTNATFTDNLNGTGTLDFNPDFTQANVYNITFIASDGTDADTDFVQITVNNVNQVPVVTVPGAQSVDEGANLNFGVSATDADGDPLTLTAEGVPTNATFTDNLNGTGTFDFNPDFTQANVYNVTFIASDGTDADTDFVQITVNNVNQVPVVTVPGAQSVDEGANLNFGISATDADGDPLTLTAEGVPTNATFTDNLNGTGTFDFNPDFTQANVYSMTFIASDGTDADTDYVQITVNNVNQVPVVTVPGAQSVDEGANLNFGVSATDADGDPLTLTAEGVPTNATFTDNLNGTGTFDFNPDFTQANVYNITFIASDGTDADTDFVQITVNQVNLAPVLAAIGPQSVTEGTNLNLLISASDPDGDPITLTAEGVPTNATFTDNLNGTGTFDFNPDYLQSGSYPVTFIVSDGVLADTEVVTVTVDDAGNQNPVLDPIGAQNGTEGQNLTFTISASDPEGAFPTLTTSTLPSNAGFTDHGDGTGTFDWTPGYQQSGTYLVTFTATDDSSATDFEQVTISIAEAGNQRPVLASIGSKSVTEGASLNFGVSATDPDGQALTMSAAPLPPNAGFVDNGNGTGNFSFDPNYTQAGSYSVTFVASDGALADSETVLITVSEAGNQAPVLAEIGPQTVTEGNNLTVNLSATDADGDSLVFTTSTLPANSSFTDNGDGSAVFSFDPSYVQSGIRSVVFRVSDLTAIDTETVFITINDAGNQNPVLDPIGPQSVVENNNLNITISASDAEGDIPTLTTSTLPPNATFLDNGDGTGVFDFNPDFTQSGTYGITFYATDDSTAVDSELVVVTVQEAGNQFPVLAPIGAQSVDENANLNFNISASDVDLDSLILSAEGLPANATFTDNFNGTGTFDFNPDYFQAGVYPVTFIASDGALADTEIVQITVNNVNRDPVLDPIGNQSVDENANLNFTVTSSDPDLQIPVLTTTTLPPNATFTDHGDGTGTFDFNPSYYQEGAYDVTFYADDGTATDSESVTITVNHVNQLPILDPIGPLFVTEGQNLNVLITAHDADSTALTFTTTTLPPNATFTDHGDGTATFDFNPDYTQSDIISLRFYVSDGEDSDSELVFITIEEAGNQPPVLDPIGPQVVTEGQNLGFTVTASDPEGGPLTLTASALPPNATFNDNGDGTGLFSFDPDFTQAGIINVTFTVTDDSAAVDSEVVQITVNDAGNQAPLLANIGAQSITEGANLNFGVSATDADGDSLILSAENLPANATFTDNFDGSGTFDFNPDYLQAGDYDVTFIASDGVLADSEVVTITVNDAGNQAPVLAAIGPQGVTEGANLNFLTNGSDVDGDSLIMSASGLPANATFVDNFDGTGTFDFNPDFTQAGVYNVIFIVSDGALADSEAVVVTVADAGNQAPVLGPIGPQAVSEGANLNVLVTASDADLDSLILSAEGLPTNATFTDNFDGTGTFDFNPDFTQSGSYDITFIVSDGVAADSEVVTVTVNEAGNQPPVLASIGAQVVTEGQNLNFNITATDPDLDSLIFSAVGVPTNATFVDNFDGTGTFDFNPDFLQAGSYDVTFFVTDGVDVDSEVVTITVNDAGNQRPVLAAIGAQSVTEGQNLNFGISATDVDLDSLTLSAVGVPTNATFTDNFDGTGTFDFSPDFVQAGSYNVTFIASDGVLADSEVVTITVNDAGNQTPVLAAIGAQVVTEGQNLNFNISATDADLDSLVFSAVGVPTNATFTDNFDGTGTFDFNPDFTQAGSYDVTFFVTDGVDLDSEVVTITVNDAGNQVPVLAAIAPQTVPEGGNLNFTVSATDADLDSLTMSAADVPANATFTDNFDNSGTFDFNPDYTQEGVYNVIFIAFDGIDADSEIVEVTVTGVNTAPTADAGPDQVDVPVGTLVTLDGTGSSDLEGDSLGYDWVQIAGTAVTLSDAGASQPTFTPMVPGTYQFELTVDDAALFSAADTVQISVINVAAPAAIADLGIASYGETLRLSWSEITLDATGLSTVIDGYVIYRDTTAYFIPTEADSIGFTDASTFTFDDTDLNGANVVGDTLHNYFYTVAARDLYGNQADYSNRVGEFDYQIVTTATTDFNLICIPFENSGIATADELIDSIGVGNVQTVNNYQPLSQSFESRFAAGFGVNFTVVPGGIYQVNAAAATTFTVAGRVPSPGAISYDLVTTATTDFSFLSVPFDRENDFQTAQDVLDNLPGSFNTLNHYVAGSQSYESRFSAGFGVNFRVRAGMPYQANSAATDTFPGP